MLSQPLVSIITPCHNHAPYLDDYFHGLLSQTYRNIELIFIDDGSTDESWQIVCRYETLLRARLARVVLERQDNVGVHATCSRALARVTGEYTSFLESDDYYLPGKVADSVHYLETHPEIGFVHTDTHYVYADRVEHCHWASARKQMPTGWIYEELLEGNFIKTCSMCCRTDLLRRSASFERYRARRYLMGDYPMFLDLARHARCGYIPDALSCYRVLAESASHSRDPKRQYRFWRSHHQIRLDYSAHLQSTRRARRAARRHRSAALTYLAHLEYERGNRRRARRLFRKGALGLDAAGLSRVLATYLPPRLFSGTRSVWQALQRQMLCR